MCSAWSSKFVSLGSLTRLTNGLVLVNLANSIYVTITTTLKLRVLIRSSLFTNSIGSICFAILLALGEGLTRISSRRSLTAIVEFCLSQPEQGTVIL